jgi:hypothetical protein
MLPATPVERQVKRARMEAAPRAAPSLAGPAEKAKHATRPLTPRAAAVEDLLDGFECVPVRRGRRDTSLRGAAAAIGACSNSDSTTTDAVTYPHAESCSAAATAPSSQEKCSRRACSPPSVRTALWLSPASRASERDTPPTWAPPPTYATCFAASTPVPAAAARPCLTPLVQLRARCCGARVCTPPSTRRRPACRWRRSRGCR